MNRDTTFSYQCNACGRCCYNKRIQVNPYEILRLARNQGISAGEFIHQYLESYGPYLRSTPDGACIFLHGKICSVHSDRPLVCRIYPLGRRVEEDGNESFSETTPHPQSEGLYERKGTVNQYLDKQEAGPYMRAVDRYQALFYRLYDLLQHELRTNPALPQTTNDNIDAENQTLPLAQWLDAEEAATLYCDENGLSAASEPMDVVNLHIAAIEHWLDGLAGDNDEQKT